MIEGLLPLATPVMVICFTEWSLAYPYELRYCVRPNTPPIQRLACAAVYS